MMFNHPAQIIPNNQGENLMLPEPKTISLSFTLPLRDKTYLIKMGNANDFIVFAAEDILGLSTFYYQGNLNYENCKTLYPIFNIYHNLKEVEKAFHFFIKKAYYKTKNFEINLEELNNGNLNLKMKVEVADNIYQFSLILYKTQKDRKKLFESLAKVVKTCIKKLGKDEIIEELIQGAEGEENLSIHFNFEWKTGQGYYLDRTGHIITNISEPKKVGGSYQYPITFTLGNKALPANQVNEWKIKILDYKEKNSSDGKLFDIGIGVATPNVNHTNFKKKSWYLNLGNGQVNTPEPESTNSQVIGTAKGKGIIVSVKLDRKNGELYFYVDYRNASNNNIYPINRCIPLREINSTNFFCQIDKNIEVVPFVITYEDGTKVELL